MDYSSSAAGRFWRGLLPVAVAGCLYVNYLYNAHPPTGALSNGAMSARHPTLLTPAGYAFSIWGVIFAGLIAYTVWQLLPAQRTAKLPQLLTPGLTLAVLATTTWTLVFSYELITVSLFVMLALLLLLGRAYARVRPLVLASAGPAWPTWFLSLYLGWIMLATVLNLVFGLRDGLGWHLAKGAAVSAYTSSQLLAVAAAAITLALAWRARDPLLPLPVAWGLLGTWRARSIDAAWGASMVGSVSFVAAVVLGLAVPLLLWRRLRPGPRVG